MSLVTLAQVKRVLSIISLLLSIVCSIIGIVENGNGLKVLSRQRAA